MMLEMKLLILGSVVIVALALGCSSSRPSLQVGDGAAGAVAGMDGALGVGGGSGSGTAGGTTCNEYDNCTGPCDAGAVCSDNFICYDFHGGASQDLACCSNGQWAQPRGGCEATGGSTGSSGIFDCAHAGLGGTPCDLLGLTCGVFDDGVVAACVCARASDGPRFACTSQSASDCPLTGKPACDSASVASAINSLGGCKYPPRTVCTCDPTGGVATCHDVGSDGGADASD
jgi:hypothetical protein